MLPIVVVPKEVTPERVHVSIIDTPGDSSSIEVVDHQISQADVVVLVYDVNDELSTSRISTFWLPKFRAADLVAPIILVGNKIDERGGMNDPSASAKMEEFIKPIMDNFREVDVCIECSAKTVSNISEVFYFAQKAVLYPTGNVYDVETHALRPPAEAALRRIFKQCDIDADGGLNDKELNDFQHRCFSVYLKDSELEGVKAVVKESRPQNGINGDGSLSVEGFIYLHTLFVQKGRLETTWIVLRRFGYDDEMKLTASPEDLRGVSGKRDDQIIEISDEGKKFLSHMFAEADQDCDGLLSPAELEAFFKDCPGDPFEPFETSKDSPERLIGTAGMSGKKEHVTLDALLARWDLYVKDNVKDAISALKYLGIGPEVVHKAVSLSKPRWEDRKWRKVSRNVLNIGVVGDNGVMSSDIVRGIVGRPAANTNSPGIAAASLVHLSDTERKTLIMQSIPAEHVSTLLESRPMLDQFDIMCVVFDGSSMESFEHAFMIWTSLESKKPAVKMPVVFVACVSGDATTGSDVLDQADTHCLEHELPTPTRVSLADGEYADLYADMLGVGLYPSISCPDYYDSESSAISRVVKVAVGTAAGFAIGGLTLYGLKVMYDYYKRKPAA